MNLDNLWAGWRANYVASVSNGLDDPPISPDDLGADDSLADPGDDPRQCVFCRIVASDESDEELHVLYRDEHIIAMLNAYPYASGHLLVMPNRHVGDIASLSEEEFYGLWRITRQAMNALEIAYHPDGMNMGANLGRAAGAGIPRHLHLHVLPRWIGDTNFMTTVASTRVMPEALADSWRKVIDSWPR